MLNHHKIPSNEREKMTDFLYSNLSLFLLIKLKQLTSYTESKLRPHGFQWVCLILFIHANIGCLHSLWWLLILLVWDETSLFDLHLSNITYEKHFWDSIDYNAINDGSSAYNSKNIPSSVYSLSLPNSKIPFIQSPLTMQLSGAGQWR